MLTRETIARLPKAELHVHLEGTFRPATLLHLAKKNGVELPADDEAGIRKWFRFRDFAQFIEIYVTCSRCLVDPEDFRLLALDFLAENGLVHKLHSRNAFIACSHPDEGHGAQFLICTRCDRIAEIADRKVERGVIAAARVAGFTVRRPMIEIEGLCPHCGG